MRRSLTETKAPRFNNANNEDQSRCGQWSAPIPTCLCMSKVSNFQRVGERALFESQPMSALDLPTELLVPPGHDCNAEQQAYG